MKSPLYLGFPLRKTRVLLIADIRDNSAARRMWEALQQTDIELTHIGEGSELASLNADPLQHLDFHSITTDESWGEGEVRVRYCKWEFIFRQLNANFDVIFHIQDNTMLVDLAQCPLPYFYWCTEIGFTMVPQSAWLVLAATKMIQTKIQIENPRMNILWFPHFYALKRKVHWGKTRTQPSGFAGSIYGMGSLYAERERVVKFCRDKVKGFEAHYRAPDGSIESGQGFLNYTENSALLQRCRCALNVPTAAGLNFRDLEIPAHGAMLVTRRTPDLDLMGFQDGVSCRYYNTPEEAAQILRKGYDEAIAREGYRLVTEGGSRIMSSDGTVQVLEIEVLDAEKQLVRTTIGFDKLSPAARKELDVLIDSKNIITAQKNADTLIITHNKPIGMLIYERLGMRVMHIPGHLLEHRIAMLDAWCREFANVSLWDRSRAPKDRIITMKEVS